LHAVRYDSAMRIAHMILSRGFAGSERATAEMCNAQCARHEVLLIIKRGHANRRGVSIRQWVEPRVQIVEVGDWLPRAGIAQAIESFRPDIIHAHLRRSTRMLARIRPRAATVVTLHITVNGPHFAAMNGIICIARWQHRDIPADYRGRVFDINLAYMPHRRLSADEVQTLRAELGVQPHEFLIGGVGRLAHSKGFDTLIEAYKRARLDHARLVIFGEGRERRRLERRCAPGISLPGFRPNVKDYYQAFDLFVCPSRREPLPYVLLEALDAGAPIVASDALGNAELLQVYRGDLFPAEDVAALAGLLRRHCATRPAKARQDVTPYFLDTVARETEAAYGELLRDFNTRDGR
jgi:glycosyltransferase involved in cell wall biosynthesis